MAPKESRPSPGRSLRSEPGQRKIGGDLQGEPIFRLSGPAAALGVPVKKAAVVEETSIEKDESRQAHDESASDSLSQGIQATTVW